MLKEVRQFLFYERSSSEHLESVRAQIMDENRRFAIIWSSAQMLYWAYCLIMSTRASDFFTCRHIYLVAFAVCTVTLVLSVFVAPRVPWLVKPIAIAVDVALLGAGVGIARFLAPKTITIFASALIVPVFFICDTMSTVMLLALNALAFTAIGINSMEPETFQWTLVNLLIFSSVGLTLGYFVNKARFERFYYAESAVQLAELQTKYAYYDQMTGLKNRRAFDEKIDRLANSVPANCCVIMADVNGLKEMNDTRGHDAGDELIVGTAECLRQSFEQVDSIYRIGGDEFCVIMNGTSDRVEQCLKQLERSSSQWHGELVNGISLSYGFAKGQEFDDIHSITKAADQRMYEFKSNYYRASGKDRRRR